MRILPFISGLALSAAVADDQTNSELHKHPVAALIVDARSITAYSGGPVGNVQVKYRDGTEDRWTLKGNASAPKVSKDGVVGWVLTPFAADRRVHRSNRRRSSRKPSRFGVPIVSLPRPQAS